MATAVQLRRGTTTQNNAFTGALGEVSVDTTLDTLRVHDASTAGGFEITSNTAAQTLTNKSLTAPTITGTAVMATLDISGDVDVDGTLETDALTIGGVTLAETISDTVGAMVSSNTETGITVAYQDADNTLDFALGAAQTTVNSILATDLILGEDAQTAIDFGTADEIDFLAANAVRLTLAAGALRPQTNNQIDLGTSSLEFKDAFFDGTVTSDAFAGPLTGNATTATTLATARTIGGTSFNGSANIAVALAATATALATARTIGGVSFDGSANIVPGTATALATARTIGGVSFNGSANIDLPGVNAAGNQATSGLAGTATALATARTIGGTSFNGTANIAVGLAATATTLATARTIAGVSFNGSANIAIAPTDLTSVTASAADINLIDGITNGTVIASKAIVTDANIDITGGRNVTISGELDAATLDISGAIDVAGNSVLASVDVTGVATAATFEPDGDTAAGDAAAIGFTAAEGLILTGQGSTNDVTIKNDADADVIEIPTGTVNVTMAGTLGVVGVVSGAGFTAGSAVIAEAELELLDGLTAGTAIASKVVTTDASIDTTGQRNLTISGELDAATGDFSGAVDIAGDLTLSAGADGALTFGTSSSVKMVDNSATSLVIEEANTAYMTFNTANSGGEFIEMGKPLDLNGNNLILDADADTYIDGGTADDTLDIYLAGAKDFTFTANTFTALAGSGVVLPDGGLTLASTAVSSTAAELNILDDATLTTAELNILDASAGNTALATDIASSAGAGTTNTAKISHTITLNANLADDAVHADIVITNNKVLATSVVMASSSLAVDVKIHTVVAGSFKVSITNLTGGQMDDDSTLIVNYRVL